MTGNELRRELKKIGDRNRRFNEMSPERKRVAIARDTIESLQLKKVVAERGNYLGWSSMENGDKLPINYKCQACALGSMFVGLTTRVKNISIKDANGGVRDDITNNLSNYFADYQLDAIESAFETPYKFNHYTASLYEKFGAQFKTDEERLVAIMQNIIDNNGTFKP